MGWTAKLSQKKRYVIFVIAAIALSAAGIVIAAFNSSPADGGRGGALAVAFSFLVLFVRRNYGARVYQAIIEDIPKLREQINALRENKQLESAHDDGLNELKRQITAIVSRLDTEASGQSVQNIALAVASVVGTIAWGFGDWIAQWINWFLVAHGLVAR